MGAEHSKKISKVLNPQIALQQIMSSKYLP